MLINTTENSKDKHPNFSWIKFNYVIIITHYLFILGYKSTKQYISNPIILSKSKSKSNCELK